MYVGRGPKGIHFQIYFWPGAVISPLHLKYPVHSSQCISYLRWNLKSLCMDQSTFERDRSCLESNIILTLLHFRRCCHNYIRQDIFYEWKQESFMLNIHKIFLRAKEFNRIDKIITNLVISAASGSKLSPVLSERRPIWPVYNLPVIFMTWSKNEKVYADLYTIAAAENMLCT